MKHAPVEVLFGKERKELIDFRQLKFTLPNRNLKKHLEEKEAEKQRNTEKMLNSLHKLREGLRDEPEICQVSLSGKERFAFGQNKQKRRGRRIRSRI